MRSLNMMLVVVSASLDTCIHTCIIASSTYIFLAEFVRCLDHSIGRAFGFQSKTCWAGGSEKLQDPLLQEQNSLGRVLFGGGFWGLQDARAPNWSGVPLRCFTSLGCYACGRHISGDLRFWHPWSWVLETAKDLRSGGMAQCACLRLRKGWTFSVD